VSQEQVGGHRKDDDEPQEAPAAPQTASRDDEVDALLDEIDDVLENNAEQFVRGFVQKGGQ
jgi:prokaryotic ubiquitin-like protein Pup